MTSEVDALKTNEILRRRKLRIQQVREQSKDIAKKIRQRANSEKFRQLVNLDGIKEKEYLEQQDKLIKKLELLHAKSIGNLGAGHKNAAEATQENKQERVDLSKQRAREAASELRRQKQEKLDERKKLLDRKLQAREVANEISREKSSVVANKLSKTSVRNTEEAQQESKPEVVPEQTSSSELPNYEKDKEAVATNDMATQWDFESWPNEWEPNIPTLSLPKDNSPKESASKTPENQSEKNKRPNLFALSEEMPPSLCGGRSAVSGTSGTSSFKPSMTLVSDYIQNRDLRLRDFDPKPRKRSTEDLQKIKQTILQSRAARAEGSTMNPVQVADVQMVPVPSWQAEINCELCSHSVDHHQAKAESKQFKSSITNSQINHIFSSIRPKPDILPTPLLRGSSPFKRTKVLPGTFSEKTTKSEKSAKPDSLENILSKKSSVKIYNHSTRDVRDVPCGGRKLVLRDHQDDEDAYSQAMKETSSEWIAKDKDHQKKLKDMRNKIAMSKQSVEKEYKDTMAFLKSLPKDNAKPIKNAYKDAHHEQMLLEHRQRKLQHEYRKIEKECRRQTHATLKPCHKKIARMKNSDNEDDFDAKDLQYSWMPVPESDRGLAVHIIPTKIKEQKSGSTVKFNKIDSYHEYRSRHKHTPPTKDTPANEREKIIEAKLVEEQDSETSTSSSFGFASSADDLRLGKDKLRKDSDSDKGSDVERIIICKILDSKSSKGAKVKKKSSNQNVAKSLNFINKEKIYSGNAAEDNEKEDEIIQEASNHTRTADNASNVSPRHLKEGFYKTVSKKGDNVSSACFIDEQNQKNPSPAETYSINKSPRHSVNHECMSKKRLSSQPIRITSSSSFKTAAPYDIHTVPHQQLQTKVEQGEEALPGSYVKVVDQNGQESGKFFIGATGFLKDDSYEVIIKLRKTDITQADKKATMTDQTAEDPKLCPPVTVEPEKTHTSSEANTNFENKMAASVGVGEQEISIVDLNTNTPATESLNQQNLVDKGLDAPYKDSFTCPKLNSDIKPSNSVSVQTSLNSPEIRYHRMSSSTSTAYMSPPEVILPKCLRDDNYIEQLRYNALNPKVYILNHEPRLCSKKASLKPKPIQSPLPKHVQKGKRLKTPPNTPHSSIVEYSRTRIYSPCKKKNAPIITMPKTMKKRKFDKRINSKICLKSHVRKAKRDLYTNIVAPPPSINNTNAQNSRTEGLGVGKNDLNPIIKQYIDKLLHMNKEGVKAIDIANQDSSFMTTPGSSIVGDPNNIDKRDSKIEPKISLEQLKQMIAQHIMKKCAQDLQERQNTVEDTGLEVNSVRKSSYCLQKKRSIHKVKSLNISRSLLSKKSSTKQKPISNAPSSCHVSGTSSRDDYVKLMSDIPAKQKHRSNSSPSPRRSDREDKVKHKTNSYESINEKYSETKSSVNELKSMDKVPLIASTRKSGDDLNEVVSQGHEAVVSSSNNDISTDSAQKHPPCQSSTQTNCKIDEQINYMRMTEDKIQNMEKIADLTEKCTQRLSNLAKVLDEVRKNKLSYNQASQSTSNTDQVSEKNSDSLVPSSTSYIPIVEIKEKERFSPPPSEPIRSPEIIALTSPPVKTAKEVEKRAKNNIKKHSPQLKRPKSPVFTGKTFNIRSPNGVSTEHHPLKIRGKPPPASMRRCLKRTQEYVVPHELSTVVEVDSPIISKYKNWSAQLGTKSEKEPQCNKNAPVSEENTNNNPDLLETKGSKHIQFVEDSAEDFNLQMMDLKQFNDIMLKPFITIQEYAKQCQMTKLEEGSNIESFLRGDVITDELSSLHSDGSLPDVIAELLKRNIISEPFKFDTASNINSTTVSSDSTLSILALSKVKRGKKKSNYPISNKNNTEETSDTLSVSSNPDLENAFKKLGMGWASSTLKKTKEHLALSSSSTNTSSSSLSQFKLKTVQSKEFPVLVTDSMSSVRNAPNTTNGRNEPNVSKNPMSDGTKTAGQQTSLGNSLTVKQFLTNELAKRITFGDKSHTNHTEEEFVSLCETKMPDEMQRTLKHGERSIDSNPRARTSTPVQLFKSMTYHSSSSSNMSNGLFSNADDLSSVKGTSNSMRNHSTSEKDDLTIPNFSLRTKKGLTSDCSRSE